MNTLKIQTLHANHALCNPDINAMDKVYSYCLLTGLKECNIEIPHSHILGKIGCIQYDYLAFGQGDILGDMAVSPVQVSGAIQNLSKPRFIVSEV